MNINTLATQSVDGLTIVQVAVAPSNTLDYLTAVRALAQQHVRVSEVSQAGHVNALRVENLSDRFVFFLDGDVLLGAKQDRVLNASMLLAPRSAQVVPVACVEAGRWHSISQYFRASECASPASLRQLKSQHLCRRSRCHPGDYGVEQGEVWNHIAELKAKHAVHAPTHSLYDVYAAKREAWEDAVRALQPAPGANGMAIWFGPRLVSVDIFNRTDALVDYFPRLVRGVMLDWFGDSGSPHKPEPARLTLRLAELIQAALAAAGPPRPALGVGTERRFDTPHAVGFTLEFENQRVHLNLIGKGN